MLFAEITIPQMIRLNNLNDFQTKNDTHLDDFRTLEWGSIQRDFEGMGVFG